MDGRTEQTGMEIRLFSTGALLLWTRTLHNLSDNAIQRTFQRSGGVVLNIDPLPKFTRPCPRHQLSRRMRRRARTGGVDGHLLDAWLESFAMAHSVPEAFKEPSEAR